ncbi:exodeoxyribonuclease VII large subunit [Methyloceanibacter methanicus]|uniref:Exodeoxyribonuclease 7 large subunit n=1 Tax=Methyloceanibacter methanicus TaxID=1774968 RepID=A0A1E3W6Q8_9HYPH|nr:exodeoxyribonuclease VII large subunit [Methyloceanibacter methanicus]ODS00787.1 exodeoxyribonuclease VII large subunit [Methyloceanibacter methanicus]
MAARNPQPEPTNVTEYSVSELAFALKRTVEEAYGLVRLRGEVSGYRGPHASGHCYFRLKDEGAAIEAVVWRGVFSRLKFKPEEGLEIVAKGKITTYPGGSKYQIVIEELEPAAAGALMALLEQRKKQLAAEGLFDEARKQDLPYLPGVIGVVTSPTGAVIRDILHRLADRFPSHVIVWPVRVQGETCAAEVAAAIAGFNAGIAGDGVLPDLIIVARGGGSLEDLWGFNEEIVARAAAASTIPLISAVGHETDWTLIDLVADYRAPTPTAAAEVAVPVRSELLSAVQTYGVRMAGTMRRALEQWRSRVTASARGLPRREAILGLPRQRLDTASGRLLQSLRANTQSHRGVLARTAAALRPGLVARRVATARDLLGRLDRDRARAITARVERARQRLDAQAKLLGTLGYHNVLARGFALARDGEGAMVRSAGAVHPGEALDIQFADGHIEAEAVKHTGTRSPAPKPKRPKKPKPAPDGGQGSLL